MDKDAETQALLDTLCEAEGFRDADDMIETLICESVVPGICTECREYTTDVEPDQTCGWCEMCGSNTVVSGMILAGVY